jgi:hypothetical protein
MKSLNAIVGRAHLLEDVNHLSAGDVVMRRVIDHIRITIELSLAFGDRPVKPGSIFF